MSVPKLSGLTKIGVDVLSTLLDTTGYLLAIIGDVATSENESDGAEWWQHVGFASRPQSAVSGKSAAQGLTIKTGARDAVVASRDGRSASIIAGLGAGETCIYAVGSDGTANAKILLKGDNSVQVTSALGVISMTSSGLTLHNSNGKGLSVSASGDVTIDCATLRVNGTTCQINTQTAAIGSAAVLAPLPAMTALIGPSGVAGVASTTVKIAP